ncbi:hypothetical protein OFB83_29685, partial [Escherichia coli]|nr:hypothetical protein [Escherichia coli]
VCIVCINEDVTPDVKVSIPAFQLLHQPLIHKKNKKNKKTKKKKPNNTTLRYLLTRQLKY